MKYLLAVALIVFLHAGAQAQSDKPKYENFSVPGAVTLPIPGSYQLSGTFVQDLNDSGHIVGYYTNESSVPTRGFERKPNGEIVLLDDPGAGTPVSDGPPTSAITDPYAINNAGVIVGWFATPNTTTEAFLFDPAGTFDNFFAPADSFYTQAFAINAAGTITGRTGIYNPNLYTTLTYGLILTTDGNTITFQSPSATTTGVINGTTSIAINRTGATTGYYYDTNSTYHSYIRSAKGEFNEFEVPGAGTASYTGALPMEITDSGDVLGFYADNNFVSHSYLRLADGTFAEINLPERAGAEVFFEWINQKGDIAGTYSDANGAYHAFVRLKDGRCFFFTDPEAGAGASQGTVPIRINDRGEVAGYYLDVNNVYHGFLWTPAQQAHRGNDGE